MTAKKRFGIGQNGGGIGFDRRWRKWQESL